jgi:hypothetical protein
MTALSAVRHCQRMPMDDLVELLFRMKVQKRELRIMPHMNSELSRILSVWPRATSQETLKCMLKPIMLRFGNIFRSTTGKRGDQRSPCVWMHPGSSRCVPYRSFLSGSSGAIAATTVKGCVCYAASGQMAILQAGRSRRRIADEL